MSLIKKNMGITLIALVVTIVVLLILAGVSITSLTGENGMIKEANEAKILSNLGTVDEAYQIYSVRNSDLTKNELTDLLQKVPVGEEGEYVWVVKDLKMLDVKSLGEFGKGKIPESVGDILEFDNLYIVDEDDNVSYVVDGKIYGEVELAKDGNDEKEPDLSNFFIFNEETGAITGIVENTAEDPNGVGWYYKEITIKDPENRGSYYDIHETVKDFSYNGNVLTIPSTINGKNVKGIYESSGEKELSTEHVSDTGDFVGTSNDFAGFTNMRVSLVISEGIEEIGPATFTDCFWITEVTLPASLKTLGADAFKGCKNLEKVNFTSGIKITEIKKNTFKNCISLEEISLPSGIQSIDGGAFNDCEKLQTINLPRTVKSINSFGAYGYGRVAI